MVTTSVELPPAEIPDKANEDISVPVQSIVVLLSDAVNVIVPVLLPLQMVNAFDGVALTDGIGCTVKRTLNGTPGQLPPNGVTLKFTTASVVVLALVTW